MPRIVFTEDFIWDTPGYGRRHRTSYKAGMRMLVTTPCAEAAVKAGKAQYIKGENEPEEVKVESETQPTEEEAQASKASTKKGKKGANG